MISTVATPTRSPAKSGVAAIHETVKTTNRRVICIVGESSVEEDHAGRPESSQHRRTSRLESNPSIPQNPDIDAIRPIRRPYLVASPSIFTLCPIGFCIHFTGAKLTSNGFWRRKCTCLRTDTFVSASWGFFCCAFVRPARPSPQPLTGWVRRPVEAIPRPARPANGRCSPAAIHSLRVLETGSTTFPTRATPRSSPMATAQRRHHRNNTARP